MRLAGLQKLTLLDYPGEVACIVFTQGCNLRCPFCQNPALVVPELMKTENGNDVDGVDGAENVPAGAAALPESELFDFLARRRGKLSGVVVSGGEPTIHKDLPALLGRIREMGFLVKLDTNGMNPYMLRNILDSGLVDYVAMDVKNSPQKYAVTCGLVCRDVSGELWKRASESISLLGESGIDCEFRTTVVLGLHTDEDIVEMAKQLPTDRPWYLQQFIDSKDLVGQYTCDTTHNDLSTSAGRELLLGTPSPAGRELLLGTPSPADLELMRRLAAELVPGVSIRGV